MKSIETEILKELSTIEESGLYKYEREIESPQSSIITVNGKEVIAADNIYALEEIQIGGFFRRSYDEIVQFFRKN